MNLDDWLQWPTKSTDPGVNFVVLIVLTMLVLFAIVAGATILVPVAIVIGIAKGVHWYVNKPVPTDHLYAQVQQRSISANFPDTEKFLTAHIDRFLDAIRDDLPTYSIYAAMMRMSEVIYKAEHLNNPLPPMIGGSAIEEGRYRDQLIAHQRKTIDAPRTLEVINATLGQSYLDLIAILPPLAKSTPADFAKCDELEPFATFPLLDVLPEIGKAIMPLILPFFRDDAEQLGLFADIRKQFDRNVAAASGLEYPAPAHKLIMPNQYDGTAQEIVSAYLHGTPFESLFYAPIPFSIPESARFEHTHIIGGIGHGKTQLLQTLMLADFDAANRPAVVAIDSQGDMIRTLSRLARFDPAIDDRLIIINPADYEWPPRLNIFDMSGERLAEMRPGAREQVRAGIIELYDYIFAGLLDAETTQKQTVVFRYLAGLMLTIPDATIQTMRQLLEDPVPFQQYIDRLTGTARNFFENEFKDKSFYQTRKQILRRLYGILSNPVFERMFSYPRNGLDMRAALDSGKVILINTAKDVLKSEASAMFGRYCIALIMQAVLERAAEEREHRRPAFVYIDEAAEYFDQNIDTLLIQARKYKVGITFAHQHLHQARADFRASIMSTAAVRFAGGVSDEDARALKSDMRTSADFLLAMKKRKNETDFACYVRNYTDSAVRLTLPFLRAEREPKMTREAQAGLLARNRAAVAASIAEAQAHIDASTKPIRLSDDPEEFADRY